MTDSIVIGLDKINNKLKILLEENTRLKQQHEILQEENRETLRNNSDLKEILQESVQRYEELQRQMLNYENQQLEEIKRIERQHQEENLGISRINSELKEMLQERDKQLKILQRKVLYYEKQKIEIQIISQNVEKTLEMLELDEDNENNNKILEVKYKPLNSENSQQKNIINNSFQLSESIDNNVNHSGHSQSFFDVGCIRVVVGLDFGTSYSGFAYCHVNDSQAIISNDIWPGTFGTQKTNTVLQYDNEYNNVISWGVSALCKRPKRRKGVGEDNETKLVELFKLHLSNLPDELKPKLPVKYEKAITDYLREIGRIMRECAFKAWLIRDKYSTKLQCITESEAAAIYCIFGKHDLKVLGTIFMVVDCGDTLNLATWKLVNETRVGLVTERSVVCESTFIDAEFIKYLRKILGDRPIELLRENHYAQFKYLVQGFSQRYKYSFTGEAKDFDTYLLDLEELVPVIKQLITDNHVRKWLEETEWQLELDFNNIRSIFDPFIENVIQYIHTELDRSREKCSAMFLIGSHSESKYLQNRIKKEFQHRIYVSIPINPTVAIAQGAVTYGLNLRNM
ncbi:19560_t:CDS:2 [Funneliformis geosporum]|uniref:18478_t:CDS:1 n=1 Tax=Funneliformis geosporum TaxID=1117311 RepID=A0A9W4SZB2_9GLOM|nr:19560_t:CDS:2 [Funneliformis geosporum]CAI2187016.1 18478_t:CDS:2 [Funneliformis geosporum]